MTVPLTPDEDAVLFEYHRRDIQPDTLDKKTIKEIAKVCNMSIERVGGLRCWDCLKKIFFTLKKRKNERKRNNLFSLHKGNIPLRPSISANRTKI